MADLSEYRIFEGVEFREEVKTLMQIFADSWYECREEDCSQCKYRHGKEQYTLMACLLERYVENIIAADVAPVRHGKWVKQEDYSCCSECGQPIVDDCIPWFKFCANCGAKMDGGGE